MTMMQPWANKSKHTDTHAHIMYHTIGEEYNGLNNTLFIQFTHSKLALLVVTCHFSINKNLINLLLPCTSSLLLCLLPIQVLLSRRYKHLMVERLEGTALLDELVPDAPLVLHLLVELVRVGIQVQYGIPRLHSTLRLHAPVEQLPSVKNFCRRNRGKGGEKIGVTDGTAMRSGAGVGSIHWLLSLPPRFSLSEKFVKKLWKNFL